MLPRPVTFAGAEETGLERERLGVRQLRREPIYVHVANLPSRRPAVLAYRHMISGLAMLTAVEQCEQLPRMKNLGARTKHGDSRTGVDASERSSEVARWLSVAVSPRFVRSTGHPSRQPGANDGLRQRRSESAPDRVALVVFVDVHVPLGRRSGHRGLRRPVRLPVAEPITLCARTARELAGSRRRRPTPRRALARHRRAALELLRTVQSSRPHRPPRATRASTSSQRVLLNRCSE